MPSYETLLLIPMALQSALLLLLLAGRGRISTDRGASQLEPPQTMLDRRHFALAFVFMLAAGLAWWWRAADSYVLAFAALFVMAQAVQAVLSLNNADLGWSMLAMRAAVVALLGLVTMLSLGLVPPEAEGMVPP